MELSDFNRTPMNELNASLKSTILRLYVYGSQT